MPYAHRSIVLEGTVARVMSLKDPVFLILGIPLHAA